MNSKTQTQMERSDIPSIGTQTQMENSQRRAAISGQQIANGERRTANSPPWYMRVYLTSAIGLLSFGIMSSQSPHKQLRNGDLFYDQGEFLEAEEAYRKANAKTENAQAQFNLGNAVYQQERYDEAVQHFESAAQQSSDPLAKAQAFHNLGNTHFRAQALDKSVQAYRNALKLNPNDIDTKKNMTMALQALRKQQQQQQKQQQNQQQEEQKKEEQQQQQQEQQQQQKQQSQQQKDSEEQPQPSESNEDLTKKEAEELLRIIDNEDSKVQEKLRKTSANPKKPKKDW